VAKKFEWFGMTIVKRYLTRPGFGIRVDDVHSNSDFFDKGIDFILTMPDGKKVTVDLKVDSYYGSDSSRRIRGLCNPDSGFVLLETISQLQYDRRRGVERDRSILVRERADVPGWFFTSKADEVYYYFLALLNSETELNPIYSEYSRLEKAGLVTEDVENRLLRTFRVDRDLLVTFRLDQTRAWYDTAPDNMFDGYAPAPNPNYLTISRRVKRDQFIRTGLGLTHGSLFQKLNLSGSRN
jgi:hypothetical protein